MNALLADPTGPRPVILIDGWDELGEQGERLRERLVELRRTFPHVAVAVSSRPYSETRPAGAEAFESLYIQAHRRPPAGPDLPALLGAACRASLAPQDADLRAAVAHACDAFDGDPLWPALARHLSRASTVDDRALLVELAADPRRREPPLSWGLQHHVRGDMVLDDDSVLTLDELCARAGIAPLPLLEDMPEELDVPLDDAPR